MAYAGEFSHATRGPHCLTLSNRSRKQRRARSADMVASSTVSRTASAASRTGNSARCGGREQFILGEPAGPPSRGWASSAPLRRRGRRTAAIGQLALAAAIGNRSSPKIEPQLGVRQQPAAELSAGGGRWSGGLGVCGRGQYGRLTHAHAAATGVTRHGAPAGNLSRGLERSKGTRAWPMARQHNRAPSAPPPPPEPGKDLSPAHPHPPAAGGDPVSVSHGSAAQWRMKSEPTV